MVYAYTSLMDKHPHSVMYEMIKFIMGAAILYMMGGWFDLDQIVDGGSYLIAIYLIGSVLAVSYISKYDMHESNKDMITMPS